MVEIREIVGVKDLEAFYSDTPEALHIVLYEESKDHEPNCVGEIFENLSESHLMGAMLSRVNMENEENIPLKEYSRIFLLPFIEMVKDNKSYYRHLGHMPEFQFYDIIEGINDGTILAD